MRTINHFNEFKRHEARKRAERADRIVFSVCMVLLAGLFILNALGV